MQYITAETERPRHFKIWPDFLDKMDLSLEAKKIYVDLLDLAFVSQYNGGKWIDDDGRVFVRCSIAEAGKMIGRKERVTKDYIKELRAAHLIDCKRNWSQSNTIYVCYPDNIELQSGEKPPNCNNSGAKNRPIVGRKTAPLSGEKPPTKLDIQSNNKRVMDSVTTPSHSKKFNPPELEAVKAYFIEKGGTHEQAERFYFFYGSKDWMVGKNKMKNWHMAVGGWIARNKEQQSQSARVAQKELPRL